MKYHALFVIFEKVAKFEIVVCCKLYVALYGLKEKSVQLPHWIALSYKIHVKGNNTIYSQYSFWTYQ